MKVAILFSMALLNCLAVAQESPQKPKHQAFVVPPEIILPVVASQPDCPLKFENVRSLVYLDRPGAVADSFELRNVGSKAIRDYTIASYTSYGGMWTESREKKNLESLVQPGALIPMLGDEVEIIPLNETVRDKFKLRERKMGGVIVFMVVRVDFADGSVFDNQTAAKSLEAYFQKMAVVENR